MAFVFQERYAADVEDRMRAFWNTLSERDRRRFAVLEATKLGFGGVEYIAEVLGCATRTIERGADELGQLPTDSAEGRVRRPGAGRKKRSSPNRNSNKI